jgi:hypothetical protein
MSKQPHKPAKITDEARRILRRGAMPKTAQPPRVVAIDPLGVTPTLDLLNSVELFAGHIRFTWLRRRGSIIQAGFDNGREARWNSATDLRTFARSQDVLLDATGCVLSGVDAARMRLQKDTLGQYLWSSPSDALGTAAVWSIPVVISPKMPAGQFLVGAFAQSALLFVRQLLNVEISFENEDDFIRNLACIRAEERCGLAVAVPQGLVKGSLTGSTASATSAPPAHHK